jgi:integrase
LDLATARTRAREALQRVSLGQDPVQEKKQAKVTPLPDASRTQVSRVVEQFLDRHARANTKPRTAEETERLFRLHVLPTWGGRKVEDITRADVIELLDGIVDQGSPIAANRTLAATRKLFNWCVERSIIPVSPCTGVQLPTPEKSRDRILSDHELRLVWRAAEQVGWPFGPLVQLLILTGQRRDEVARMRWSEIRENGTLWTIPGDRTKNGVVHDVPLSKPAQQLLNVLPRMAGAEYVFTTTGSTPVSGYSNAKERLDSVILQLAQEAAEADGKAVDQVQPWRLHDIRRTVASGMARLGQPVHVIEAVLNHRSGTISGIAAVYNRYSYYSEKRQALDDWSAVVITLGR